LKISSSSRCSTSEDAVHKIFEVHTQDADGRIGNLKMWLNMKRGRSRENVKGYVKEFQFRTNQRFENKSV